MLLLFKVVLVSGFASIAAWVGLYTWLTRWGCWRNPIGRALLFAKSLLALALAAAALPAFVPLTPFWQQVAGWADVTLLGLITPAMIYRIFVWWRLHRAGKLPLGKR
jgi:hypothetical protein